MAHHNIETDTISESIEMYLLRIALLRADGQPVPIPTLAQELSVSTVSANEMCRRLVDKGFIDYKPYRGVTLTAKAEALARRILRNRRLWEVFFVENLGLEPEEADEMACRFEHVTPDKLAERLAAFLGHPTLSPRQEPIPYDNQMPLQRSLRPLTALPVGAKGRVAGIKANEAARSFLQQHGLTLGMVIEVLVIAADGGLLLATSGQRFSLSKTIAAEIDVTIDDLNISPKEFGMEQLNLDANIQQPVLLNQLRPGQAGKIIQVGGRAAVRRRLLEMGLVRGETITVERVAPLGDPVEFTIKGYHLSLRRQDAANIEVELKN